MGHLTFESNPTFDDIDQAIVDARLARLNEVEGLRCGDYILFADGVRRRVSHIWPDEGPQTSDGGSYYLGDGYVSFSGSLHRTVPFDTLTLTEETMAGDVWIFHHDWRGAHRGVPARIPFRVYACSTGAPN